MLSYMGFGSSSPDEQLSGASKGQHPSEMSTGMPDKENLQPMPLYALDSLKHSGVPLRVQMTPYLQMDPSIFRNSQPQYILPEGNENGRGKFELVLGQIGAMIGGAYAAGCARGLGGEIFNAETKKLRTRPYMTRLANATVKHGSGFAQQAGVAMFLYSAIHVGLKFARADDDLNSIAAAAIAGALFRSPYGLRSSLVGSGVALALVMAWNLGNRESRDRLREMVHLL